MKIEGTWILAPNEACAHQQIDDETVVVQADRGTASVLNAIGGQIFSLCDGKASVDEIVDQLDLEYDLEKSEIRQQVEQFAQDLMKQGLIRRLS